MRNITSPRYARFAATILVAGGLAGCAAQPGAGGGFFTQNVNDAFNNPDVCSNNSRNLGIALGAVGGALIGGMVHNSAATALIGAAAGAAAGGLIGHEVDVRRCRLYHIAEANHIRMASAVITADKLGLASSEPNKTLGLETQIPTDATMFEPGTANLTPQARVYFGQIAQQYHAAGPNKSQEKILIVGHSSQTEGVHGESAAELTKQRALAVSRVFAQNGIPENSIYYQGAGNALPIATPGTPYGRQDNSRIQIVGLPSKRDLGQYLNHRATLPPPPPVAPTSPSPVVASTTRNATPSLHAAAATPSTEVAEDDPFGFDGVPTSTGNTVDLGPAENQSIIPFITTANAAAPVRIPACIISRPHPTSSVRNLATGRTFGVNESIPGMYGAPWAGDVGNSLIALLKVDAPAAAGIPVPDPTLQIFKDKAGPGHARPAFSRLVPASVYRAKNADLYRVEVNGPVKCIDMIKSRKSEVATAYVYYGKNGHYYEKAATFSLKK